MLSTAFTIFNFLTYGTTAQVARLHGAGRDDDAAALGSQALWLGARRSALLLLVLLELSAPAVVSLMGGEGEVKDGAVLYLRISRARRAAVHARQRRPGLPARRSATCGRRC